jgi:hypothetical protein
MFRQDIGDPVTAQRRSTGGGEHRCRWVVRLLAPPGPQDGDGVFAQGRAAALASFPLAANVGTGVQADILPAQITR